MKKNIKKEPVTILIIEDDPGLSELIAIDLQERGWKTARAFTGDEALKKIPALRPALLLLDYSLPDMSAAGFIDEAERTEISLPPFIVATGRGDERIAVDMMKRGARDYIVKDPQLLNNLSLAVERVLKQLETERRLKESEQKFQTLFDAMNEMAVLHELVLDPAGNPVDYQIVDCNPAFSQITGIPGERAAGSLGSALYGGVAPHLDIYARVVQTGEPVHFDSYFKPMKKTFSISAFRTGPQQFATVATDITERKRAEEVLQNMNATLEERVAERTGQLQQTNRQLDAARAEAERANKAKSIFLASMSHEIRTPMNAVLGYTQFLRRSEPLTDTQREYLTTIMRSGEHLLELINQILELSKIEAGHITLNPHDFDLHQLLADIQSMFRIRANEKKLTLETRHEGTVPSLLYADSGKIRQVLINVIGNAMKFTEKGGIMVTVRDGGSTASGDDHLIIIEVADTGPGMPAEEVARIFDRYEQTTAGMKDGTGTGLGLTLSRHFAELMEGTLTATSVLGQGTILKFIFRAASAQMPGRTERPRHIMKRLPPGLVYKILIVDDNVLNRDILRILLEEKGFNTHEAANGREAITAFREWKPDLVFMDLRMPEMDGLEAIGRIRATSEGAMTPIVAITASALDETETDSTKVGANGFIRKPFREEEIFTQLARLLNLPHETGEVPPLSGPVGATRTIPKDPVTLKSVSETVRREIKNAALRGEVDTLRTIADQLPAEATALALFLRNAANNFDYDVIANLLEDEHE